MTRSMTIAAITTALFLGSTATVQAVTWASSSSPLTAYEDGTAQAQAHGNFRNHEGIRAQNDSRQRDPRPGGDSVYVQTGFYWYSYRTLCDSGSGGVCWWKDVDKQTDRSNSADWDPEYRARDLRGDADQARGKSKVCEDQSWSPDPCSSTAISTFAY